MIDGSDSLIQILRQTVNDEFLRIFLRRSDAVRTGYLRSSIQGSDLALVFDKVPGNGIHPVENTTNVSRSGVVCQKHRVRTQATRRVKKDEKDCS